MPVPTIDPEFLRRLGLKEGQRLVAVRAPAAWAKALVRVRGVDVAPSPSRARHADIVVVWLEPRDDLRAVFARLESKIPAGGAIWAVIPKKSALSKGEAAVEWQEMQSVGLASGRLVDNKELRFDDRYYGTRFVVRKDYR
jgi:hypothetical protein